MKLLFGTGNMAKLSYMQERLGQLPVEIIGLKDLKMNIPNVPEEGKTPLDNARQKAKSYYQAFGIPVFSCDSGLYFDGVPDDVQPGVHVRRVNGKELTDEEMVEYYSGLAKKYGDLRSRYKDAICLILDENHIYESMDVNLASEPFIITSSSPHKIKRAGFPLDSLSIDIGTGKYFYDMEEKNFNQAIIKDGFIQFFDDALKLYNT